MDFRHWLSEKLDDSLVGPLPKGVPRQVYGLVHLPGKATAVIGMRRAGKTTFLHQQRQARLNAGATREQIPYLNFEDERLAGMEATDLSFLIEAYYRRFPALRGQVTVTWCLDEIQVVPGWERFVRRILDSEQVDVFLSGSSAALLSREIATAMRGRGWEVLLHPFSFREYLEFHGHSIPEDSAHLSSRQRSAMENAFREFLLTGGFPEAQSLDVLSRHQLLRDYVDVAMLRDIVERHQVSNVAGLRWLVRHLLANAASLFSVEKFYAALKSQGLSISKDTVHQLLAYLEDCFLVRTVWISADSERRRMVNPRKAYPIDTGLIPVFDRSGRSNIGHALETAVLLEIERRRLEVTYLKTSSGWEVDFLTRSATGEEELIQVSADASQSEVALREIRALKEAGKEKPTAVQRLLTLTRDGLPRQLTEGVMAQPAYEWMLS